MPDREAAGQALHRIEHPCTHETVWDMLDEPTRAWWTNRAQPVTNAVRETMNQNPCEAEERCLRLAFEIELMWGSGTVDLGKLKRIATGDKCTGHDTHTGEHSPTAVKI